MAAVRVSATTTRERGTKTVDQLIAQRFCRRRNLCNKRKLGLTLVFSPRARRVFAARATNLMLRGKARQEKKIILVKTVFIKVNTNLPPSFFFPFVFEGKITTMSRRLSAILVHKLFRGDTRSTPRATDLCSRIFLLIFVYEKPFISSLLP